MPEQKPVRGYGHTLRVVKIVCRMIGFDQVANEMSFKRVLDLWVEQAELACDDAQRKGLSAEELEELTAKQEHRETIRDEAMEMYAELNIAAEKIARGFNHPSLELCHKKYAQGFVEFYKPSVFIWARESRGKYIPEWAPSSHGPVDRNSSWATPTPQPAKPTGISPSEQLTEGRKNFLTMAWLFDKLMTAHHGDWRQIINDETDETLGAFLKKGKISQSAFARKISGELPAPLSENEPSTSYKNHAVMLDNYLRLENDPGADFHHQAMPMARLSIYSLSRLLWAKENDKPCPSPDTCEYPKNVVRDLMKGLPDNDPISEPLFEKLLENARQEVIRQRDRAQDRVNKGK